jgi:hypothetical protein
MDLVRGFFTVHYAVEGFFQSLTGMRGISNKSDVRAYHPRPCMRPISFNFGVSM